ncbi:MAG: hypothetical protein JSU09_11910 [Bacteroidetes bacterium]|nr:hypothetical protein [Bacteroidota bacterium]
MKKNIIALCMVVSSVSSMATIRTVSNNPAQPAQFSTFAAAQSASVDGDTIYVQGSPFQYTTFTITKRLVIVGSGYAPNNSFGQPTNVANILLSRVGGNNASGTTIMGFISGSISPESSSLACDNITLLRNRFSNSTIALTLNNNSTGTYCKGWVIANNIFQGRVDGGASISSSSPTNILFANNIFVGQSINGFNSATVVIDHNIFLGASGAGAFASVFRSLYNVVVSNNIFSRSVGLVLDPSASVVYCTFNNNLSNLNTIANSTFYNPANDFANFVASVGGANTGSGNIIGQNPLFTTNANPDAYNTLDNYRLQASSPGKNAGNDGTDIGIYGGAFPFPSGGAIGSGFDTGAMPAIPQVTNLTVQTPTLAPGAQLKVTIQATVNN